MDIGDTFSESFKVTPNLVDNFIGLFHDKNLLHTDHLYARNKGFEKKVAHGNILAGFLSYFVGMCLPIRNVILIQENFDFHLPFFEDEALEFKARVKSVFKTINVTVMTFTFYRENNQIIAKGNFKIKII